MCNNQVTFHVQRGYDFRQVTLTCGRTDPWGGRVICEQCASDATAMSAIERIEESIAYDNNAARSAGWGEF